MTNRWSMCFLAVDGWKSGDSKKRRKNSYTICKCGQLGSRVGSSSSGSNCSPLGFVEGGRARKALMANYTYKDNFYQAKLTSYEAH